MRVVVCGAGGFIGGHLVKRLRQDGCYVVGVDCKQPDFEKSTADVFNVWDLRTLENNNYLFEGADEVYQLAAEVGGMGYVMDPANDAEMLRNSMLINLRVLEACRYHKTPRVFFPSSACVYPTVGAYLDHDGGNHPVACRESDAWPYQGDNHYAHEKMFAEFLYDSYARNYGLQVRIGRLHNCFGELGTWTGGREKFPAALCRKVAEVPPDGGCISLWGDGTQTRSFTYVQDTVEGIIRLTRSDFL